MNTPRLRHLFSHALTASLAVPWLLSGCRGEPKGLDTTGFTPVTCHQDVPVFDQLGIQPAPDSLELRRLQDSVKATFGTEGSVGEPCKTAPDKAACATALTNLRAHEGFPHICYQVCVDYYFALTRGDEVSAVSTVAGLRALLSPVDTAQKAALIAYAQGYDVCGTPKRPGMVKAGIAGTFQVIGTQGTSCGRGNQFTQHRVEITPSGGLTEKEATVLAEGDSHCSIGRRPVGLQDVDALPCDDARGRYFADAARLEATSIQAFLRLRDELALHGADTALQDAALASALDEVLHADVTARIARRFGGTPPAPAVEALPLRSLLDVALDNAVEGCVRETYGALVAHHQALHAADPELREALARIAEDETRHAELSWDVDAWAFTQLTPGERERLREARQRAVAVLREEVAVPLDARLAADAGLPSPEVARALLDTLALELWT